MKIKSIYIDGLHNAVNKTYDFGDINYIFGNNGIGKSTILQAIQYALLGYIPGTAKNSKEALLRHSPKGQIDVILTLIDDSGNDINIERKVTPAGSRLSTRPSDYDLTSIIADLEIPIFNFNEFVGQTANKLKEYFIKNILSTSDGKIDWIQILEDAITDCNFQDKDSIIRYGLSLIDDVETVEPELLNQVVRANTLFKEDQSFKKAELQRLQNTIDSLIYYDDYVGPTDIDEINASLLSLSAIRDQVLRYNSIADTVKSSQDELEHVKIQLEALGGRDAYDKATKLYPQLQDQHNKLTVDISNRKQDIAGKKSVIANMESLIHSEGICTYTKKPCKDIVAKIDTLRNDLVTKRAEVVEAEAELENVTLDNRTCIESLTSCENTLRQFNTLWDKMLVLQKTIGELPNKPNTDKTLQELDQEIAVLSESKSKLQANIRYNETIENITKLKYETELQSQALALWVKKTDTNGLQTTLMMTPFEDLADTMTGYIRQMYNNADLKAHFNISSKANSFSFGLIRDGIYIPYDLLSSGEKCLYSLALMICIVNNNKSPLKVLLCDDMFDHLDANTIESTFATLKNISGIQFIFAGVKECNNASDIILTV